MESDIRNVRIERYFPDVLANSTEFKALAAAVDPELVNVWVALWWCMLTTFVMDIDEAGATRWETMLKIRGTAGGSLENRRAVILAKINSVLPYTERRMEQILDTICGGGTYTVLLDCIGCELGIRTEPDARGIERLYNVLRPMVPCNLGLFFEIVRKLTAQMHIGIGNIKVGRQRIGIERPSGCSNRAYLGIGHLRAGKLRIGVSRPDGVMASIFSGVIFRRTGRILIGGIR